VRDNHLKADDYFDAAKYLIISMKSVSFKQKGGNNFVGMFNITIKGKTKAVEAPFTYTESASQHCLKAASKLTARILGLAAIAWYWPTMPS
jgi:polyisoprenoid-binding protein YceI